jgi:xylulokinase
MQRAMKPDEPGALILLPHFSGSGNPFFNAGSKGFLYGLTLDTKREDIARAAIEALCYDIRLHLEAFAGAGMKFEAMRAVGGGAAIDKQLQLKANITGLRVIKGAVTESSAMGAAAYAAFAMGELKNPADAYAVVKQREKVFEPDMAAYERFRHGFLKYRTLAYAVEALEK